MTNTLTWSQTLALIVASALLGGLAAFAVNPVHAEESPTPWAQCVAEQREAGHMASGAQASYPAWGPIWEVLCGGVRNGVGEEQAEAARQECVQSAVNEAQRQSPRYVADDCWPKSAPPTTTSEATTTTSEATTTTSEATTTTSEATTTTSEATTATIDVGAVKEAADEVAAAERTVADMDRVIARRTAERARMEAQHPTDARAERKQAKRLAWYDRVLVSLAERRAERVASLEAAQGRLVAFGAVGYTCTVNLG